MPVTKILRTAVQAFSILVVFGAMLPTRPDAAQDAEMASRLVEKLPQGSKDVIGRLSEWSELPSGQWKMHAGDLAHGEAVNLDDSSWQSIAPRSDAPKDAVWFRQTY